MRRRLAILAAAAAIVTLALPGGVGAAATQVVSAQVIGAHGTLLVATSNGMTVYTFDKDVAGSGVSSCTGGCLANWPALTVAAGDTPTAGAGVTGTLATITRTDNGAVQVTYDGLPLYFYINDAAPGDTNGIYPNWRAVVLAAPAAPTPQAAAVTPPPTSTEPTGGGTAPVGDPRSALLVAVAGLLVVLAAVRRLAAARP